MTRLAAIGLLILAAPASSIAAPELHQAITTSWLGLSGLYVIPTARTLRAGRFSLGFNESKHTEFVAGRKFTDRQVRGVGTYGIGDRFEITATCVNDILVLPPDREPQFGNQTFKTFGLKLRILDEDPHWWFPAVAIGVRDVANDTRNVGPLKGVNNGTKGFIVASKRMLRDDGTRRFMDVHAGISFDEAMTAGFAGFELTLAPNASLIAEGVVDAPYLSFKHFGANGRAGPYLFNTGLRIYPELVPGLVLDAGFVGDSEFEFSFGASYVMQL